ncbi:MAG: hypothetical protein CVU46_06930 [Chloroflexi bacterium HGW-Chloroflexi-8]|nr:MAG: hypothetical protein CVU46_06930 [Chloroflexi bacterium HGW-Chloroflexi-8]
MDKEMNKQRCFSLKFWFKFYNKRRNQENLQNQKIIQVSKQDPNHEFKESHQVETTDFNLILGI